MTAGLDSASANDRLRPGGPGESIKFTFTASASAYQEIRAKASNRQNTPLYVSIKCTVAAHIVFGNSAVGAPTNAEPLFEPADGWQDVMLLPSDTGFRVKGDTAGGDIYIWISGH